MTLPKHIEHVPENREAYAPYNFVPLPEKIVPAEPLPTHDAYHTDCYTGHIECMLTTESPLYVRCGYDPQDYAQIGDKPFHELTEDQRRKRAEFFNLGDRQRPVIPGSSLRGMLRALVEIAGYGKMEKVTGTPRYFFRAVAASRDDPLAKPYRDLLRNVRAGYLVRRGAAWYIQPTSTIGNDTYLKVRERDIPRSLNLIRMNDPNYRPQYIEVSFTHKRTPNGRNVVDRIDKPRVLPDSGWLVTSGNMIETGKPGSITRRRNHCVVLPAKGPEIKIADQAIKDYCAGLTEFQKGPTDIKPEKYRPFSEQTGVLKDGRPVFYCEPLKGQSEILYFGHSPNFRVPYWLATQHAAASPADFVPGYLKDPAVIDLAEAIFGYVRGKDLCAGRVFVSDATLISEGDPWLSQEPITPRILATPKPTTFQHYLVQPNDQKRDLKHYASTPETETVIRGHKLYWHKADVGKAEIEDREFLHEPESEQLKDTQHTQVKPVKPGISFSFTIRYENLSKVELGALLWVLHLGADERYRLNLGMGKPLGMGSVKITYTVSRSDHTERYSTLFDGDEWATGDSAMNAMECQNCIDAFSHHVLEKSDEQENGYTQLIDTLRIRCLLALLNWHDRPDSDKTRYMEIEHESGKVNEYKDRPVLPIPLQVIGAAVPRVATAPRPHPEPQQPAVVAPPPRPVVTIPEIGAVVTGQRNGLIREPGIRGVKVDINKKWYQVSQGTTVVGVVKTEHAGGQVSGGFSGEVTDQEHRGKVVYLFLKPRKVEKKG
jgi:CRISPR-associated protein (TIGR03986 family)